MAVFVAMTGAVRYGLECKDLSSGEELQMLIAAISTPVRAYCLVALSLWPSAKHELLSSLQHIE
jgi:hypothetical protein